jgi:signal transduction histidine kinase
MLCEVRVDAAVQRCDVADAAVQRCDVADAGVQRCDVADAAVQRCDVAELLDELALSACPHAEGRGIHLSVTPAPRPLTVDADHQLLASAVMDLLNNAFKYTRPGGRVVLRAHEECGRVLLEVEDQCGGILEAAGDPFQALVERRGRDRTGLDLELSITREAVDVLGGHLHVRNVPGTGCVFVIDVPLATEAASTPTTTP